MRVLIAGCGDLGLRIGRLLAERGDVPIGLRRNPPPDAPFEILRADVREPETLGDLPAFDAGIYALTPASRDERGYRAAYVDGARHLLERSGDARWLYVSSSSVWGDHGGAWVDETTPCVPDGFNGRVLLEGEAVVRERAGDAIVLRLSGLYGPGRTALVDAVRAGRPIARTPHWTNRIHVDDAARAAVHLLSSAPGGVYVGSDDAPTPMREVADGLATILGVPPPPVADSPARGNKRLSNAKLRKAGFTLIYPSWRDGYTRLLTASP